MIVNVWCHQVKPEMHGKIVSRMQTYSNCLNISRNTCHSELTTPCSTYLIHSWMFLQEFVWCYESHSFDRLKIIASWKDAHLTEFLLCEPIHTYNRKFRKIFEINKKPWAISIHFINDLYQKIMCIYNKWKKVWHNTCTEQLYQHNYTLYKAMIF